MYQAITLTQILIFSDAINLGYGANIYLCSLYKSDLTEVNLICSKSRIPPMKTITIPRLELLQNLFLSYLIGSVKLALKEELKFERS